MDFRLNPCPSQKNVDFILHYDPKIECALKYFGLNPEMCYTRAEGSGIERNTRSA